MQTLGEAKQFAAEFLGEEYLDERLSVTLLPRWVARGLEKIYRKTWWRWNEDKISLSWPGSTAEGSIRYLPHFLYRIISLSPSEGGRPSVEMVSASLLDYYRPASVSAWGFRPRLVLFGYYGVEADNPSQGLLTVACAGGVGNQSVRIHGLDSSNYEIVETVTVAAGGSTPTTNSFKAGVGGVRNVELFGTANGGIITVSRGGVTLERLDSTRERRHEHLRSELIQAGSGGSATFVVRFWRRPSAPSSDTDIIPIPFEFHSLLETWIESELYKWRGEFDAFALTRKEFEADLMEMVRSDRRDPALKRRFRVAWGRGEARWF